MPEELDKLSSNRWPFIIAIFLTIAWLIGMGVYLKYQYQEITELDPNEYGDFLAGIFAPLAFLWIVAGYFMQSQEFRLQVKELRHQVSATRHLSQTSVEAASRAAAIIQPKFMVTYKFTKSYEPIRIKIENTGKDAYDVSFRQQRLLKFKERTLPIMKSGAELELVVEQDEPDWILVSYQDLHYQKRQLWLYYDGKKSSQRALGDGPLYDGELNEWLNLD